jgi:hypothetical protein
MKKALPNLFERVFLLFTFVFQVSNMPSFDITSKVDPQSLDNAVNITRKDIDLEAESDMKIKQVVDVLIARSMKQGLDPLALDLSKEPYPSGKMVKKQIPVKNGIKQEDAKKLVKLIKDSGLKVQVQIMDDMLRVTGKKIDDLQSVIQLSKNAGLNLALQYGNMRS